MQRRFMADPAWQTVPLPHYACPLLELCENPVKIPKLLAAYLSLGAKICGPPALDREFKSIDFLTFLDLEVLPAAMVARYLS
jgi:putative hemolysin